MHAAKSDFKSEDIVQQSKTVFYVKSKGASANPDGTTKWWYNVQLGNDHSFPKCECFDFEHHYLPCKHFFAIFLMIPGYSWESLPDYFRNSPFITIDNFIILPSKQVQLKESEKVNESLINCTGDGYLNIDDGDANKVVDTQPSWTNDDKGDAQCLDRIPDSCTETSSISISAEQDQLGSVTVISQKLRSNLKLLIHYSYTCKNYSSLMGVNDKVTKIL